MYKHFLIFILILFSWDAFCQTPNQKDSLIVEMCNTLNLNKNSIDSTRIQLTYDEHLYSFLNRYPPEKHEMIWTSIFYRFQKKCSEYREILDRLYPPQDDDQHVSKKPEGKLNKEACSQFKKHRSFYYLEDSGDTVNLKIENAYWVDRFNDGTYSKLKVEWIDDCTFDIIFIESNNELRMNFSYPGDKYRYELLDVFPDYYLMSVQIVEEAQNSGFEVFKLYIKKLPPTTE